MRESEYTSYEEYVLSFQAAVRQVAADWQVQAVNGTLPFDAVMAAMFYFNADSDIMAEFRQDRERADLPLCTLAETIAQAAAYRQRVGQRPNAEEPGLFTAPDTPRRRTLYATRRQHLKESRCAFCLVTSRRAPGRTNASHDTSDCRKLQYVVLEQLRRHRGQDRWP
jgi:hypothetical protein